LRPRNPTRRQTHRPVEIPSATSSFVTAGNSVTEIRIDHNVLRARRSSAVIRVPDGVIAAQGPFT
jgi:hypothetical protein